MKREIAIIGGGVAGLTAGYALTERGHAVTLFERSARIGGNAYCHRTPNGEYVDIAVAAFGKAGYRRFYELLDKLGVETALCANSYMSFHDLDTREGLYITGTLKGLWAQKLDWKTLRKMASFVKVYTGINKALAAHDRGETEGKTFGEVLGAIPDLAGDTRAYLLCILCLLSSMDSTQILESPASFFIRKLKVHNDVISPKAIYSVRCVKEGTRAYVNALAAPFRDRLALGARVRAVERSGAGVTLRMEDGSARAFDAVVFACHADEALRLLAAPTALERELLAPWRYKDGRVVLHQDLSAFPPRDLMQAYTFLYRTRGDALETSVNGALWYEPQAPQDSSYVSSQHPNFPINPARVELDTRLRTPIFDFASCATIPRLPSLNGGQRSTFCGSHFGFGLHEDAVSSALDAADACHRALAAGGSGLAAAG